MTPPLTDAQVDQRPSGDPNYITTPADLQALADLTAADWQRTLDRWNVGRFKADYDGTEVRINTSWIPDVSVDLPGMSLRDYFAGQALAGGARVLAMDHGNDTPSGLAREAYIIADAMLAARTEAK